MAKNVVVVGTQWGDEGKGKIVDWLTDHAQGVVRFQGGHNAGHTLVIGGQAFFCKCKYFLIAEQVRQKQQALSHPHVDIVQPGAQLP